MKTRSLGALALASLLPLSLAACVQSSAGSTSSAVESGGKTSLTVFVSGDTNVQDLWQKGLIPAFEKAHPDIDVSTSLDLHGEHDAQTQAKLAAAVKQGKTPGYDLVDAGWVSTVGQAGLLAPVDTAAIPSLAKVPQATRDQGGPDAIPYRASSVLLAYDSTQVSNPPKTLDELLAWIEAHPGQFAYNSPSSGGSGASFVATVLAKYLTPEQQTAMQTTYDKSAESAWDQGFATLKALGPSVYQGGVYPNGNAQVLQLLGSGAISMAPVWSDQFITAQKAGTIGDSVKFVQISNPSFTGSASYLGVPKTEPAEKVKAVEQLADFVLSSDGQAIVADAVSGYPVVPLSSLPAEVATKFADADPGTLRLGFQSDLTSDMKAAWAAKVPS